MDLVPEPRIALYGFRTKVTPNGPEVSIYVQCVSEKSAVCVEYEEPVSIGPGESSSTEVDRAKEEFRQWVFSLPCQRFVEGVVEG